MIFRQLSVFKGAQEGYAVSPIFLFFGDYIDLGDYTDVILT